MDLPILHRGLPSLGISFELLRGFMQGSETIEAIGLSQLAALAYQVLVAHLCLAESRRGHITCPSTDSVHD